jgi:hypothetical protein
MCIVLRLTKNGLVYYFLVICINNSHEKHILGARLFSSVKTHSPSSSCLLHLFDSVRQRTVILVFCHRRPSPLLIAVRRGNAPSPQLLRKSSDSRAHAIAPAKPLSFAYWAWNDRMRTNSCVSVLCVCKYGKENSSSVKILVRIVWM